jgi:hypothetical protein
MISLLSYLVAITLFVFVLAYWEDIKAQRHPITPDGLKIEGNDLRGAPLNVERLLWAIEQAENTPPHVIGAAGERSQYQIKESTWRIYSNLPFPCASSTHLADRMEVERVARAHLNQIRIALHAVEAEETPYLIALGWGAGIYAMTYDTASARKRDYAQRVENLYFS